MKKIYKTPKIENVVFCSANAILEGSTDPFIEGSNNGDTQQWQGGGLGGKTDDPDAKPSGRFWDDEY